jgi:hypothetical protein
VKRPGFMHASLRVCLVRVAGTVVIVVLGLGFGWWPPAEAVHEPAGVVPPDPGGGDLFNVRQGFQRAVAER